MKWLLFSWWSASVLANPSSFLSVGDLDQTIDLDIRYFTKRNFLGAKVDAYRAPKCLLAGKAAKALVKANKEFRSLGYTIRVYDCYRPQTAVNHFVRWAKDLQDTKKKAEYYPRVAKNTLFKQGYIASKSGHSRGATVDLSLVPLKATTPKAGKEDCADRDRAQDGSLDMGTNFDCFDVKSHTASNAISKMAHENRTLLVRVLQKYGFENYDKEWWHFTYRPEPFPKTFFDFPIQP